MIQNKLGCFYLKNIDVSYYLDLRRGKFKIIYLYLKRAHNLTVMGYFFIYYKQRSFKGS